MEEGLSQTYIQAQRLPSLGIPYRGWRDCNFEEILTKDNLPSISSIPTIFQSVTVNVLLQDQTTEDCRVLICVTDKIKLQVSEAAISKSLNKDGQYW